MTLEELDKLAGDATPGPYAYGSGYITSESGDRVAEYCGATTKEAKDTAALIVASVNLTRAMLASPEGRAFLEGFDV